MGIFTKRGNLKKVNTESSFNGEYDKVDIRGRVFVGMTTAHPIEPVYVSDTGHLKSIANGTEKPVTITNGVVYDYKRASDTAISITFTKVEEARLSEQCSWFIDDIDGRLEEFQLFCRVISPPNQWE